MNVRFEVLHGGMDLRRLLREDGWVIENRPDLSASHPEVTTESDARRRLSRLGILTSPALRIAFPRHMPR
jgi:hypothetical protein